MKGSRWTLFFAMMVFFLTQSVFAASPVKMKVGFNTRTDFTWGEVNPGQAIGPIGPGQEINIDGDFIGRVFSASLEAATKWGDADLGHDPHKLLMTPPRILKSGMSKFLRIILRLIF